MILIVGAACFIGSNFFLDWLDNQDEHVINAVSAAAALRLPFSESDRVDHPVSVCAATKKANDLMAHTYSHLYGIPTTGLRFFAVYGH